VGNHAKNNRQRTLPLEHVERRDQLDVSTPSQDVDAAGIATHVHEQQTGPPVRKPSFRGLVAAFVSGLTGNMREGGCIFVPFS
jgi:hypothetical protein